MTDSQFLAVGLASVPTTITVLIGILINNARLGDLRRHIETLFNQVDQRFDQIDRRFDLIEEKWRRETYRAEKR